MSRHAERIELRFGHDVEHLRTVFRRDSLLSNCPRQVARCRRSESPGGFGLWLEGYDPAGIADSLAKHPTVLTDVGTNVENAVHVEVREQPPKMLDLPVLEQNTGIDDAGVTERRDQFLKSTLVSR